MANPNTKIIIQEIDETSPKGAGVSSDIAYIPGLAVSTPIGENAQGEPVYAVKNKPVLCYTVSDFESAFGTEPYVMTEDDVVKNGYDHTYSKGGYDRSYIYAKELLQAGLSVYYENIAPEDGAAINIASTVSVYDENLKEELSDDSNLKALGGNSFTYIGCKDRANTPESYQFTFTLPVPPKTNDNGGNILAQGHAAVKLNYIENPDFKVHYEVAETVSPFVLNETKDVISWTSAKAADFKTEFVLKVTIQYIGKEYEVEFPVSIVAVEGPSFPSAGVTEGRIKYFYDHLGDALARLEDKNEYTVKYITSGGYPTFDIGGSTLFKTMASIAGSRGDALALIDHLDRPEAPHGVSDSVPTSIFNKVNGANGFTNNMANLGKNCAEYAAMFTPWGKYSFSTITDNEDIPSYMPASFGYLMCMASAIATSPNWLAMAGVTRGMVPGLQALHTDTILSNVVAEDYQPKYGTGKNVSINCITNVKPYGLCIWGNRTLQPMKEKGAVALNFLNTRNMVSDIKKVAYSTAKALMFEQESDMLWLKFKSMMSPLLDQLVSGYGISGYKLIKGKTKYNGQALTRGEMAAVIKIFPIAPIEYFEITVVLADNDVQVS